MPEVQPSPSSVTKFLLYALAALYLLGPLALEFTSYGFLGYRAAPNQIVRTEIHEVMQSTRACKSDDCDDVPDVWRDRRTGTLYRRIDFIDHRVAEAQRVGWTWLAYGLLGSLGAVLVVSRFDESRLLQVMMISLSAAVMASVIIYLQLIP